MALSTNVVAPPITGGIIEPYTPAVGRIRSAALAVNGVSPKIQCAKFILSAASTVTFVSYGGALVTLFALPAGLFDFPVREIRVVTTGSVLIVHDGQLCTDEAL